MATIGPSSALDHGGEVDDLLLLHPLGILLSLRWSVRSPKPLPQQTVQLQYCPGNPFYDVSPTALRPALTEDAIDSSPHCRWLSELHRALRTLSVGRIDFSKIYHRPQCWDSLRPCPRTVRELGSNGWSFDCDCRVDSLAPLQCQEKLVDVGSIFSDPGSRVLYIHTRGLAPVCRIAFSNNSFSEPIEKAESVCRVAASVRVLLWHRL